MCIPAQIGLDLRAAETYARPGVEYRLAL
jgi:hypothetical protein